MRARVHMSVFAIGTALALVAGVLAAPLYSVYPNMGDGFLIISFVVVVIGGLGSVSGAFWSALVIGLVDTLGKAYVPQAGRARRLRADGGRAALAALRPVRAARMMTERGTMLPRIWTGWPAGVGARCSPSCRSLCRPITSSSAPTRMISAMLALSLQLLVGCTGLVSLGHARLLGLAAYTVYLVTPASRACRSS